MTSSNNNYDKEHEVAQLNFLSVFGTKNIQIKMTKQSYQQLLKDAKIASILKNKELRK